MFGGASVKELPASPGNIRDAGPIPELGRTPRGGNDNHSSILAWEIAETEEPSGPQSKGLQRARHD